MQTSISSHMRVLALKSGRITPPSLIHQESTSFKMQDYTDDSELRHLHTLPGVSDSHVQAYRKRKLQEGIAFCLPPSIREHLTERTQL